MRFSDFIQAGSFLDIEYIVGYEGFKNKRIKVSDLFEGQILGNLTDGFIPRANGTNVLDNSVIFQRNGSIVINGTSDTGYSFSVFGKPDAGGLFVSSDKDGAFIQSLSGSILDLSGPLGSVFNVPVLGNVSTTKRITHPDAVSPNESATLGQVNVIINGVEQDLIFRINEKVDISSINQPFGVAGLDSSGKIPTSLIPDFILGQVRYIGTWNVNTNTPALPLVPGPETKGNYYIVNGNGTFAGNEYFEGDWIISNGEEWQIVKNTDTVRSVFGRIGDVLADENDYSSFYVRLSQTYNDPTWIASIAWSKISGAPDFLLENQEITLSGDVTGSGKTSISTTISDGAVTNSKLRASAGLSVIGRSVASSGAPSDIIASSDNHVLRRSGSTLSFGLIGDASITDLSWSKITGTPTSLSGYGILDAYTKTEVDNILGSYVPYTGATQSVNLGSNSITANSFVKSGGTSSQFLKADGSVDSTSYVPVTRSIIAGTGLTGGGNLSADRTISFDTLWGDNRYVTYPVLSGYVPYTGATQNVNLGEFGIFAGHVTLDNTPTNIPTTQGTMYWNVDNETISAVLNGYTMQIGEDTFYPVKNQTGVAIPKGTAVRFAGTVGNSGRLLIAPFIANGTLPSSLFMGVTAEDIPNGEDGKVLWFGKLRGINTNSFNEGDVLYASTTVAGGFQTAVPVAPNNIVQIAAVVTKSTTVGEIFIRPQIGSNINNDEGVKITSPAAGQLLQLQSNGLWENRTLAQILGGTSSQFVKADGSLDSNTYLTSVPAATTTILGGVRLFSDTVQTVASNAVTATASRTYGIQVNSSGQMVVNVPWTDTVYAHPTQTDIDVNTSGANIISRVTVNTLGHTTAVEQRTLTLANLGYTGATNADNYGSWLLAAGGVAGTQSITSGATATFSATSPITVSRSGATITYSHANSGVTPDTYNNVTVDAFGHVTGGSNVSYLTSETDPTVPSHVKAITTTNISNWDTAFGWGNHAVAGYAFTDGSNAFGTWGINVTGSSSSSSTDFLHSDRDFPNGTLVQTSIPYSFDGDPFVLEIRGNSYFNGNQLPFDIQIQGYIFSGTIIANGGYSNGFPLSGIRAVRINGNLCFWWPSQGYWQGFNVKVYVPYSGRRANLVTSITNSGLPTNDKEFLFSPVQSWHTGNLSSPIQGSGTTNFLAKFTAAGSIGNSQIFDNGTNVGIGTTNPLTKVDIFDLSSANVRVRGDVFGGAYFVAQAGSNDTFFAVGDDASIVGGPVNSLVTYFSSSAPHRWYINGAERMRITSGGNVGIGTTNPDVFSRFNDLTVGLSSSGNVSLAINAGSSAGRGAQIDMGVGATRTFGISSNANETTIGTLGSTPLRFETNSGERMRITSGGNVGIGTTNPTSLLDVQGPSGASGSTLFTIQKAGGFGSTEFFQYYNSISDYGINIGIAVSNATNGRAGIIIRSDTSGNGTLVFNTTSSERMRITSSGNVLINTTSDNGARLQVNGDGRFTGDVIAFSSSDIRLKDNLVRVDNSLEKINQLGGYSFTWNDKQDSYKGKDYGVVAQEVEAVFPELVQTRENGYKAVKYEKLVPVLIEAIKELSKEIKELKGK